MYLLITIILGYLFGCINGSQVVGKQKNINVKQNGMKNAGASNTALVLGLKYGFIVLFIDIFKAIISLSLLMFLLEKTQMMVELQIVYLYINALFIILGHNYPITMNFDGGKGTASFFGVLLFFDWRYAIISFILLLILASVTNYFVIGVLAVYLTFITYSAYVFGKLSSFIAFLFTLLFLLKHYENFRRIPRKEEVKFLSIFRREAS